MPFFFVRPTPAVWFGPNPGHMSSSSSPPPPGSPLAPGPEVIPELLNQLSVISVWPLSSSIISGQGTKQLFLSAEPLEWALVEPTQTLNGHRNLGLFFKPHPLAFS